MLELAATPRPAHLRPLGATLALLVATAAQADVTVTQDSTINVSIMTLRSHSTDKTAGDRQRRDSDTKLDGPLSFLAGNPRSSDIVRLDRDLEWRLETDKKRYTETPFPTPEQRAAAQQKMQAMLEKAKQCPSQAQTKDPTEGCEKSEPRFDARKTDETATIAGHATKKSLLTMTYTCKNVKTGDVCDFTVANELWISQDAVQGEEERRKFALEYAKKLGLDELTGPMMGQMRAMMGPYLDQLKQVAAKAGDLKGTPLRTKLSVTIGGAQCAAAKNGSGGSTAQSGDGSTGTTTEHGSGSSTAGKLLDAATGGFGSKLAGGLFGKKPEAKPAEASAAPTGADAGATPKPAAPVTHTLLSFTTEIKSISTDAVPADQFEVPAGFQKNVPKAGKDTDDEFTCPKSGG